ncbi:MAG: PDZ domain-containing protein [Thermoanaerobaculia bacterium]
MKTALFLAAMAVAHPQSGWLGIGFTFNVTKAPSGRTVWLFVQQLAPGGPADRAGLRPQDVITAINGRPLWFSQGAEALRYFSEVRLGDRIALKVKRSSSTFTITVVAGKVPPDIAERRRMNEAMAVPRRAQ